MKVRKLRNIVGGILFAGHLTPVVYVFFLLRVDKFTWNEVSLTLAVMAPLFTTHIRDVVANRLAQQGGKDGPEAAIEKVFWAVVIPSLLFLSVMLLISWKAFGPLVFPPFISILSGLEAVLGVSVAMVARTLFAEAPHREAS